MTANDQPTRKNWQHDVLGDWLYPNIIGGTSSGSTDDRKFFVAGFRTTDPLKKIREYYWTQCRPDRPDKEKPDQYRWGDFEDDGGFMMSGNPRFFYRIGPPMHVVHVTSERTISVFAVSTHDDEIELSITYDAR